MTTGSPEGIDHDTAPDPDVLGLVPRPGRGARALAVAAAVAGVIACVAAWTSPAWRPSLLSDPRAGGGTFADLGEGHALVGLVLDSRTLGHLSVEGLEHDGPERIDGAWILSPTSADWAERGFLGGRTGSWTMPAPAHADALPAAVPADVTRTAEGPDATYLVIRWSGVDCAAPTARKPPTARLRWLGLFTVREAMPDFLAPGSACGTPD